MSFVGKLELRLQGLYFKTITTTPTRNYVKFFASKHLKNTTLASVKLMQMQFRKTGKGALFSLVNLLREFLLRIQLSYIRPFMNYISYFIFASSYNIELKNCT